MKKIVQVQEIEGEGLESFLNMLGFSILSIGKKNANGPDIWATKNGRPYSIELKKCRKTQRNSIQVPPVEKNRRDDDFILIQHPTGYFHFEKMEQHLNNCTKGGYRTLWS
jgi:hypothetical protein